jgi:hypothetical protein
VNDDDAGERALARPGPAVIQPWRGDDHKLQVEAAQSVGLVGDEVALDLYTKGFSAGMTIDDPLDGAIVARGRTPLKEAELVKSVRPAMRYLGIGPEYVALRVHDGKFEMRIQKRAAEAGKPVYEAGKVTLKLWVGFGLIGFTLLRFAFVPDFVVAILWGLALLLGGWQLRKGMASGRAMLAARIAMALGMLAQAEQLVLPPDDAGRTT